MGNEHQLVSQNGSAAVTEAPVRAFTFNREVETVVAHADEVSNNSTVVILPTGNGSQTKVKRISIDKSRYHLFVIDEDIWNASSFTIPLDKVLNNYMSRHLIKEYEHLTDAIREGLTHYKALFVMTNPQYKSAGEDYFVRKGYVTDIRVLQNSVQITFCADPEILRQQDLNEHTALFGIWETEYTNELDEIHWAIKEVSIEDAVVKAGIEKQILCG